MDVLSETSLKTLPRTTLIESTADIALLMDSQGVILDVQVTDPQLMKTVNQDWCGRNWSDTVATESREKISELLELDDDKPAQNWRQVNHPAGKSNPEVPVRYRTFKLGRTKKLLGVGMDLTTIANLQQHLISAQQVAEQDYWQLRQAESKYRLLFQSSLEAVLVVDAETGTINEVNPVAMALLSWTHAPEDRSFWSLFTAASESDVRDMMASATAQGRAKIPAVELKDSNLVLSASAALLRQGDVAIYIIHLHQHDSEAPQRMGATEQLGRFFESMPDAFAVTNELGIVHYANRAFADLAQLPNSDQMLGASLSNWLGRASVDLNVLLKNLSQTGRVRHFQTEFSSAHDVKTDAEISAARLKADNDDVTFGFVIRTGSQQQSRNPIDLTNRRSVEELTQLVGRVPLKELVRESSELIERLSIEAALQITQNNRAAAAEMLKLSRQSLYVKIRRYNIADKSESQD